MNSRKYFLFFTMLVSLALNISCYADEKDGNELSLAIGFVSAEFSYKKRVSDKLFIGPSLGIGSSRTTSFVSDSKINQGSIRNENWLDLVASFQATKTININTGLTLTKYSRVLDEFSNVSYSGNSTGIFVQPEIGSEYLRIGTKISVNKFHEDDHTGMGIQWTPLVIRAGFQW